jgi:DNA-binding CsgD family transcriptional regulator
MALLLAAAIMALLIAIRLKKTKKELTATAEVLDETIEELRPEEGAASSHNIHLAKREKEVARLIMDGKTNKEIASEMGVNEQTVFWYRKRLYAKLNVHSAVQLASEMQKLGLDQ